MKSAGEFPRSVSTRTRTQQSGTRTRSLVIEYEYHRKRLSTSTNARQIELTISGSFQAVARLDERNVFLIRGPAGENARRSLHPSRHAVCLDHIEKLSRSLARALVARSKSH